MKKYLVAFIIAIMLSAYDSQAKESLDMFSSFMVGLDLPAELSKLEEKGEISAAMAWIGRTDGYLATVGIVHWGTVVCVYNIGYIAFLMRVPDGEAPAGGAGLVFFLIFITQLNDVAQYCWGKALGKHKITPKVSPNKTWEGAIGGWLTTAAVFFWLAPYFTPLSPVHAAIMGIVVPMFGFFGDITMSAVKRDIGVKDTSKLIPGHGGVLDRLDSLTFAAPVYFHLLAYFAIERF